MILYFHLFKIYCLLSGFSFDESKSISETLMERFEIRQYKDVKSMNLSGGNQRKVCTAISLIGRPKVRTAFQEVSIIMFVTDAVYSDGRADKWDGPREPEPGEGDHQGGGQGRPERPHDLAQHGRV